MRAGVLVLALALASCGLLKKKTPDAVDASVPDAAALPADDDAGADATVDAATPAPIDVVPVSAPGGPFQGTYKCGGAVGVLKVSQQGDHVTAAHTEASGGVAHTAQCTVTGMKCTGTYKAIDTKTMKAKPSGPVTIEKTPRGDVTYKAGASAAATCKKQ